jgi:hypothetical protein
MQDNLETAVEFLLRPRQRGLSLLDHWLRPIPAKMAPFITGADRLMSGLALYASGAKLVGLAGLARRCSGWER